MLKKRTSKYGVSKKEDRTYNGKVFDSKLEMRYKKHLEALMSAKNVKERVVEISEQVPYDCYIRDKKIDIFL